MYGAIINKLNERGQLAESGIIRDIMVEELRNSGRRDVEWVEKD